MFTFGELNLNPLAGTLDLEIKIARSRDLRTHVLKGVLHLAVVTNAEMQLQTNNLC